MLNVSMRILFRVEQTPTLSQGRDQERKISQILMIRLICISIKSYYDSNYNHAVSSERRRPPPSVSRIAGYVKLSTYSVRAEIDLEFIHKIDKLSVNDITNWANYSVT